MDEGPQLVHDGGNGWGLVKVEVGVDGPHPPSWSCHINDENDINKEMGNEKTDGWP